MESFKGSVFYYRVFDVGHEIDLQSTPQILENNKMTSAFRLRRPSRSVIVEEAPVVINLGARQYDLLGRQVEIFALAKLWHFGAISIQLKIPILEPVRATEFKTFARFIENDPLLEKTARDAVSEIMHDLSSAIKSHSLWHQVEDYIIYVLDSDVIAGQDFSTLLRSDSLYDLILTETNLTLSQQVKEHIRQSVVQYSTKDICIIDWNSALVCSDDEYEDVCDVLEFGLTQLLELRYYDSLLDKKLSGLYKEIQDNRENIFRSNYAKFAKESAFLYIEISDIIERIENSLKFIGDVYYARVYRLALERFRSKDWSLSIDTKLKNLAEISTLFKNDVNERRNQLLELIIIVLIAIEVIPFIGKSLFQ